MSRLSSVLTLLQEKYQLKNGTFRNLSLHLLNPPTEGATELSSDPNPSFNINYKGPGNLLVIDVRTSASWPVQDIAEALDLILVLDSLTLEN